MARGVSFMKIANRVGAKTSKSLQKEAEEDPLDQSTKRKRKQNIIENS